MELTPLLKQYHFIKEKHKEELLLFRMGDFYELFYEDAKIASKVLGITLTSKPVSKDKRVPMAGFPFKAAETYIKELLKKGYKVAICEQIEEGKKLFKREVIEVLTPGTITIPSLLKPEEKNFIASFYPYKNKLGTSLIEITTGEFIIGEIEIGEIEIIKEKFHPSEILIPKENDIFKFFENASLNFYEPDIYDIESSEKKLLRFLNVLSLDGFGIKRNLGIIAASYLIDYVEEKKKKKLEHIKKIKPLNLKERMILDKLTKRNLEIVEKIHPEEKGGTLFEIINRTKTPMGKRFLRENLTSPLINKEEIEERLLAVETLIKHPFLKKGIEEILEEFCDLERTLSKIVYERSHPRDIRKLGENLSLIPKLKKILEEAPIDFFKKLKDEIPDTEEISELILNRVNENPPEIGEGEVIKRGINKELDELREWNLNSKEKLKEIEKRERERTGIPKLRIGYNSVFGYYIEVTKSYLNLVPKDYIRKQTLTNSERFITQEIKEIEAKIIGGEERVKEIEKEILKDIEKKVIEKANEIQIISDKIALLDMLISFAEVSKEYGYTKPEITYEKEIYIKDGRHPVVEKFVEEFIPNDTELNDENFFWIITGPNMSGKSTYLRQVALTVLLAQCGCFVPAKEARIGIVDRIFTRIGASDDISRGVSTFYAEMAETANIINNATEKSLIILDEIGRGTSTYDGLALAWSISEEIVDKLKARTLFATHYHELTNLAENKKGMQNYTCLVKEWKDEIIFLRKIVKGVQDKSYGIYVAKIAGIPEDVIKRAKEILKFFESKREIKKYIKIEHPQLELFERENKIIEKLKNINVDEISPKEALNLLYELKKEIG
ncbi:MAG: DNA mismatch repair protein MutS [candidate division WOR-3 bacterium]